MLHWYKRRLHNNVPAFKKEEISKCTKVTEIQQGSELENHNAMGWQFPCQCKQY